MCNCIDWQSLIGKAIEKEASDIHMTVGQKPHMRCQGVLSAMDADSLTENFMVDLCEVILNENQRERLTRERDMDLFRAAVSRQCLLSAGLPRLGNPFAAGADSEPGGVGGAQGVAEIERCGSRADIGDWQDWERQDYDHGGLYRGTESGEIVSYRHLGRSR